MQSPGRQRHGRQRRHRSLRRRARAGRGGVGRRDVCIGRQRKGWNVQRRLRRAGRGGPLGSRLWARGVGRIRSRTPRFGLNGVGATLARRPFVDSTAAGVDWAQHPAQADAHARGNRTASNESGCRRRRGGRDAAHLHTMTAVDHFRQPARGPRAASTRALWGQRQRPHVCRVPVLGPWSASIRHDPDADGRAPVGERARHEKLVIAPAAIGSLAGTLRGVGAKHPASVASPTFERPPQPPTCFSGSARR